MLYQGLLRRRKSGAIGLRLARWLSAGLILASLIFNTHQFNPFAPRAAGPPPCLTVSAAGPVWQSLAFVSAQSGTFTAEMDATPLGSNIDAGVGLSNGPQTAFGGLACIARFNTSGNIDARNGGDYAAATTIPYLANTSYHFRFVVNVPAHTYSVYVTPAGGSEQAVGVNYAFRTEQATVGSLNNYGLIVDGAAGSARLCNFSIGTDRFGVTMLNPTIPGGREWFAKWDDGHTRTLAFGQDPYDPEFHARGTATYSIDGQGVLTASGEAPRMYVYDAAIQTGNDYDPASFKSWNNVEVTVYFKRVSDQSIAYGGIVAGAKIRHIPDSDLCGTRGYYGRLRNDGKVDFDKEISHPNSVPRTRQSSPWPALPYNTWIGYKFVIRDVDGGTHVKLELWRDLTDGANGGSWEKLYEYTDAGGWGAGFTPCKPGVDPAQIMTGPNMSVLIRDDKVTDVRYKKWSIREIAAQ